MCIRDSDNTVSNTYTWTYDGTAPTVAITSSQSAPATGSTFAVTITFSESTSNFVNSDITVGGGSSSLSGSGATYTATITPSADGTVTVDVAAGVATDAVGNSNTAATQYSIESDQANAPSITSTAVTTGTEDSAYSYTVTTSDADDGTPNSNTVSVACSTCPSWLSYSSTTGKLTGTPSDSAVGANSVVLTATDGDSLSSTQSFTVTVANINDIGSVAISGTNAEDSTLTATVSDDDGLSGVTISYTWQSSADLSTWSSISGGTSSTFTLTQTQVGSYMRIVVQYTDQDSTQESHTAMLSTAVANVNDANTGTPTISGTTTEGQTLTASASPLSGNDEDGMTGSSFSYQWQRCTSATTSTCSAISGATSSTYALDDDDAAKYVRVGVSYDDDEGTTETVYLSLIHISEPTRPY